MQRIGKRYQQIARCIVLFEDSDNPAMNICCIRGVHEVVAVFDARADLLELRQFTNTVLRQPLRKLILIELG